MSQAVFLFKITVKSVKAQLRQVTRIVVVGRKSMNFEPEMHNDASSIAAHVSFKNLVAGHQTTKRTKKEIDQDRARTLNLVDRSGATYQLYHYGL